MNCSESRAALWPPERPRLAEGIVSDAKTHVASCASCQEYFDQDQQLLSAYQRLRNERAPRRVRERVFDALARERAQTMGLPVAEAAKNPDLRTGLVRSAVSSSPGRSLAAAAVVILAISAGVLMFGPPMNGEPTNSEFVEDYLRRAVGQDRLDTEDPTEVSRFVMRELGVMITPLTVEGLQLTAVEVCLLKGRRGAMINYVMDGREISHYVVPKADSERRAPALATDFGGSGPGGGPSVITWSSGIVEQALVGDLGAERLLALAQRMPDGN